MATKSFEELNTGALTIKNNELPESNTHTLVGGQLVDMVAKEQEIDGKVNDLATGEGSNIDILKFNPETVAQLEQIGQVRYNPATQCLEVKLNDEVTLSVGLDNYMRGKNADSIDLEAPMVVFVSGGLGDNALLTRASNDAVLGEKVIGVITQGIAKNSIGFVATSGIVNSINTSAYAEGDVLWLGTNGSLTNVKPDVSVNQICIGVVLRSHATEGSLLVAIKDDWRGQVAQLRSDLNETITALEQGQIQGVVYDVSYHNDGAVFESISTLLSSADLSTLIPESVRRGGMSIWFIQGSVPNSENKYIQFRCTANEFTTDVTKWSICDEGILVDSSRYIYVKTDEGGRLLYAIERNGNIKYGAGVPTQIKEYIAENLVEIIESIEGIATKVDKVPGKSLIDAGFASSIEYVTNPKYIKADTDKDGRILGGYLEDGSKVLPGGAIVIPTKSKKFVAAFTDCLNKVILGFEKDGNIYLGAGTPRQVKAYVGQQIALIDSSIKTRVESLVDTRIERRVNTRQISNIYNAARYDVGSSSHMYPNIDKDFQIALAGDAHGGDFALNNIVELANKVKSIDGVLVLGDMNGWTPYDKYTTSYDVAGVEECIERIFKGNSTKPFFFVCGNHDSGEGRCVMYCRTHEQVYNTFVKPIIDNNILKSGEYAVSGDYADRCYYYHDFDETKTRLIALYDYGFPLELGENDYWEPVAYDSTKGLIQPGTTYTYDENNPIILNTGGYKEHSFRLIQTVTTLTRSAGGNYRSVPYYKIRSRQIYTKNQIDWLISTLNSTPDGYGIVIASHQCLIAHTQLTDNRFSAGSNPNFTYKPRENGRSYDMLMDNNIIPKIINAWKNKTSLSEKVAALDDVGDNQIASYLNVLEDAGYHYMYEVNADFSSRTNNNAYFSNYINGHEHIDMIEKSKDFQGQLTVGVTTPNPPYRWKSDFATVKDENSPAYDSITVFACSKNRIALCKYGNDTTFIGTKRDFEIINPNDNN